MRLNFEKLEAIILPNLNYYILLVYTIMSIVFTYPVAFSRDKIAGHGDVFWFLWDFWWFKKAISELLNPYYTNEIFYPSGVSLAFSEVSPFNAIISVPLQYIFGLINAYNIIWISTFVLSGLGTFMLVKYLINDTRAAFISGLIFMFSPYRFAHALGHMNLISTEWIPFYILFLIKITREDKKSNIFIAAIFLFLIAMSSNYYLVYIFIFAFIYILYYWFADTHLINKNYLKRFFTMFAIFIVGFTPLLYIMLKEILSGSNYMYASGFVEYSADLLAFFTPSVFHPIFKDMVSPINSHFTGNAAEFTVFSGYTVLFLSIISIIKVKNIEIRFWTLMAITSFILCLGPVLHVLGTFIYTVEGHDFAVPLPYIILMHIPFFSMARVPSRWDVLVMLALAILAGYAVNYILNRDKNVHPDGRKKNLIFIIISLLILFEFMAIPFWTSSAEIPTFYKQLENDDEDYAILEVPVIGFPEVMYYQTVHEKKLVGGYVSRTPDKAMEFLQSTPLIHDLLRLSNDTAIQDRPENILSILNYYNIKYIILHSDRLSKEQLGFATDLIHKSINEDPIIYENESMVVYKVKTESIEPFVLYGNGFHEIEHWSGVTSRWMPSNATLLIISPENRTTDLNLRAVSFYRPRTLEIKIDDELAARVAVPVDFIDVNVSVRLAKGTNTMRMHVPEGCERPCDIKELNNPDSRCLSIAIQNVNVT